MIAVAFRKIHGPSVPTVGFVTGKSWREIYNIIKEAAKCDPRECEYTTHGLFLSTALTIEGDDYVPLNVNSNVYELATEPHSWKKLDWDSLLNEGGPLKRLVGKKSPFDQTVDDIDFQDSGGQSGLTH